MKKQKILTIILLIILVVFAIYLVIPQKYYYSKVNCVDELTNENVSCNYIVEYRGKGDNIVTVDKGSMSERGKLLLLMKDISIRIYVYRSDLNSYYYTRYLTLGKYIKSLSIPLYQVGDIKIEEENKLRNNLEYNKLDIRNFTVSSTHHLKGLTLCVNYTQGVDSVNILVVNQSSTLVNTPKRLENNVCYNYDIFLFNNTFDFKLNIISTPNISWRDYVYLTVIDCYRYKDIRSSIGEWTVMCEDKDGRDIYAKDVGVKII